MFSPSDLMKRVGVGGGLVPFFKCVCVYFLGAGTGAGPSAGAAAAKCAPVLCLLAAVLLLPPHAQATPGQDNERRRYARRIALGLLASALGDALLVWPQHFVAGMCAFALAHLAYMAAFRALAPRLGAAALLFGGAALYLRALVLPPALRLAVPLYALLLTSMAWRALRTLPAGGRGARELAAPAGALLFLLSDAVLGYTLFGGSVPYKQVVVMSTYYLGQLGLALSALLPPSAHGVTSPQAAPH